MEEEEEEQEEEREHCLTNSGQRLRAGPRFTSCINGPDNVAEISNKL